MGCQERNKFEKDIQILGSMSVLKLIFEMEKGCKKGLKGWNTWNETATKRDLIVCGLQYDKHPAECKQDRLTDLGGHLAYALRGTARQEQNRVTKVIL